MIIHKLLAWRSKAIDDIRSILATGIDLDLAYIDGWTLEWEVDERWQTVRPGAGRP